MKFLELFELAAVDDSPPVFSLRFAEHCVAHLMEEQRLDKRIGPGFRHGTGDKNAFRLDAARGKRIPVFSRGPDDPEIFQRFVRRKIAEPQPVPDRVEIGRLMPGRSLRFATRRCGETLAQEVER